MEFRIPKSAEAPLEQFIKLSPDQRDRLADAIRQAKPALLVQNFMDEVISYWREDPGKAEEIIGMLAGMYLARIEMEATVDDFVAGISSAIRKRAEKELIPKDAAGFEQS